MVSEWSKERGWKPRNPQGFVGSNPTRSARIHRLFFPTMRSLHTATSDEQTRRREVLARVIQCIESSTPIPFLEFYEGSEPSSFAGSVDCFSYQFEGEEDLLHLIVSPLEGSPITAELGLAVAAYVLRGIPLSLVHLRPGEQSVHFYVGHDHLLTLLEM